MLCQGITGKKLPCQNKVSGQNKYCRFHGDPVKNEVKHVRVPLKPSIANNNTNNGRPPIPIISNRKVQDCSICLCEVEEDCGLICGHAHHIECIRQLFKAECPVCKAPLQFKQNNVVDIDKIKVRELKDKEEEKIKTIEEDRKLALEQTLEEDINYVNGTQEENDISRILQASILQQEMDEYEQISRAAEESYLYQQSYEEQLLKEVMAKSIVQPTEKELLFHYLDQIFDGKDRVMVFLNH